MNRIKKGDQVIVIAGADKGKKGTVSRIAGDKLYVENINMKNDTAEVMTYQLDRLNAGEVDFAALRAAKLVPATAKQAKIVKKGDLSKKFVLKGLLATAGAKAAVEAAGGSLAE